MDLKRHFITVDETWIHHYTQNWKEPSNWWIETDGSALTKEKTVLSAGKFKQQLFWDYNSVLLLGYLHKGKVIKSRYYCDIFESVECKNS